jgi:hypothetical protein
MESAADSGPQIPPLGGTQSSAGPGKRVPKSSRFLQPVLPGELRAWAWGSIPPRSHRPGTVSEIPKHRDRAALAPSG